MHQTNRHIYSSLNTDGLNYASKTFYVRFMHECMYVCMYVGWRDVPVDSSVLGSLSADFVSQSSKCPSLNFTRCFTWTRREIQV